MHLAEHMQLIYSADYKLLMKEDLSKWAERPELIERHPTKISEKLLGDSHLFHTVYRKLQASEILRVW